MSYFVVIREAGPAWLDGKGAFDQPDVQAHAAYMNRLADDGVLLFAGPVGGSEQGRIRVVLVASAETEAEIRSCLADDPWARADRLTISSIEAWNVIVGGDRLAAMTPG